LLGLQKSISPTRLGLTDKRDGGEGAIHANPANRVIVDPAAPGVGVKVDRLAETAQDVLAICGAVCRAGHSDQGQIGVVKDLGGWDDVLCAGY
jgi:hypothetical protein